MWTAADDDGFRAGVDAEEVREGGAGGGAEAVVEHDDVFGLEGLSWGVGEREVAGDVDPYPSGEQRVGEIEAHAVGEGVTGGDGDGAVEGGPVGEVATLSVDVEAVVEGLIDGIVVVGGGGVGAVVVGFREGGDLLADGMEGVESAEACAAPGFDSREELREEIEGLKGGAAGVATEVKDQFGFSGGSGQAEEFLRGVLEVGFFGEGVAVDEVGNAEDGDFIV